MTPLLSARDAYGRTLLELGRENEDIVVLDADLSGSTRTSLFAARFPERHFEMGIAEANMIGTAAGLASCGKIPFASTFAIFGSRAWEQIRNTVCRANLNVNLCFTHAGISVGEDGASAQANEDMAIMRVLPNMRVICPCDSFETAGAVRYMAEHPDGPYYLRLGRAKVADVLTEDYRFELGKGTMLRDGGDVTIIACGPLVQQSMAAAEELAAEGIQARVITMPAIKPIDEELILAAAAETKGIVTAEEHQVIGGLGSAVAEVLARKHPAPMRYVGVQDTFGESGTPDELFDKYGLSAPHIAEAAKDLLG